MDTECEKMKLFYVEFTSEETVGLTIKRKHSIVRANSLQDCYDYTEKLHNGIGNGK
jgi:hypothetical protein